jgi:hypothetical protein|tara:strand:- start:1000 stop:1254 length:255 start_codon:yes stop_codon:yes gene_type:complete
MKQQENIVKTELFEEIREEIICCAFDKISFSVVYVFSRAVNCQLETNIIGLNFANHSSLDITPNPVTNTKTDFPIDELSTAENS